MSEYFDSYIADTILSRNIEEKRTRHIAIETHKADINCYLNALNNENASLFWAKFANSNAQLEAVLKNQMIEMVEQIGIRLEAQHRSIEIQNKALTSIASSLEKIVNNIQGDSKENAVGYEN